MRPLIVFPLVLMACIHVEPIKPVLSPPETSDFASALVSIQAVNPSLPCEDFKGKRTGIVVHPNGYVLTTNSVLEAINSSDIEVCHQNQTRARAIVVGKDPLTDLAVLKIGSSGLRYLGWADPNSVTVGDPVVMANLNRPLQILTVTNIGVDGLTGNPNYEDFIEVEGPFRNVDFSGVLVNMKGQLIGINAVYLWNKESVGYAISRDLAVPIADRLIKHGKVIRAWTGVAIQKLTPELSRAFNSQTEEGVLVSDVNEHGAAYEVGIRRGDVIVEIDGKPIKNPSMYRNCVSLKEVGSEVKMKVVRNGQPHLIYLHLKKIPQ